MSEHRITGGCQCGAVRYACTDLGRPSICHCRMCQKAMASPYGAFITGNDLVFTRGEPRYFQSSNKVRRGFCGACGTPLTYEFTGMAREIAILTLDAPDAHPPVLQVGLASKRAWCDGTPALPHVTPEQEAARAAHFADLVSFQHPDFDTDDWTPRS